MTNINRVQSLIICWLRQAKIFAENKFNVSLITQELIFVLDLGDDTTHDYFDVMLSEQNIIGNQI